eukprot:3262406-Ditylum_brightwellii.AAC.1
MMGELEEEDGPKRKKSSKEKTFLAGEGSTFSTAIRHARNTFKYVNDHRQTLQPRSISSFNTVIMKALEATDIGGVKVKGKKKIEGMTQDGLAKEIKKVGNAMRKFLAWYRTKIKNSKIRKGECILKELENLQ